MDLSSKYLGKDKADEMAKERKASATLHGTLATVGGMTAGILGVVLTAGSETYSSGSVTYTVFYGLIWAGVTLTGAGIYSLVRRERFFDIHLIAWSVFTLLGLAVAAVFLFATL